MKNFEVKCRKCKDCYIIEIEEHEIENYHEEIESQCPYCEHEEYYNFFSICRRCGNETGFHLGSLTDTLIDIGSEMLGAVLDPWRGIRGV